MKKSFLVGVVSFVSLAASAIELDKSVMSEKFWEIWNDAALKKIDADIEKYRKAGGAFTIAGVKVGADGTVAFRGFRGKYRLSWTDEKGEVKSNLFCLYD